MSERVVTGRFQPLPVEQQAELMAQHGLDTLMVCPDAWALRHRFTNIETGEDIRARCGSWSCPYCGPRKVDQWRQLVKAAEPTLFVTLTKCGTTLKEAARTLTTVLQYLRRGAKGRGKNRVGMRPAYPLQVFAVLEEHSDFEENGFHWHLLVKGVDFLPNQVVSDALRSATKGRSYITKVKRVKNSTAVGYVTKYLTKEIMRVRRGQEEEERVVSASAMRAAEGATDERGSSYLFEVERDEQGQVIEKQRVETVAKLCKARRIRYSKEFFPTSTAELRRQLFGEPEETEAKQEQDEAGTAQESSQEQQELERVGGEQQEKRPVAQSPWVLREAEPFSSEMEVYRMRRYRAVVGALEDMRGGRRLYSRRVVGIWNYQRGRLRSVG